MGKKVECPDPFFSLPPRFALNFSLVPIARGLIRANLPPRELFRSALLSRAMIPALWPARAVNMSVSVFLRNSPDRITVAGRAGNGRPEGSACARARTGERATDAADATRPDQSGTRLPASENRNPTPVKRRTASIGPRRATPRPPLDYPFRISSDPSRRPVDNAGFSIHFPSRRPIDSRSRRPSSAIYRRAEPAHCGRPGDARLVIYNGARACSFISGRVARQLEKSRLS